jgi:hypothetical protein
MLQARVRNSEVQQSGKQYVPEGQEEDEDPDPTVIPFTGLCECHLFQDNLQRKKEEP